MNIPVMDEPSIDGVSAPHDTRPGISILVPVFNNRNTIRPLLDSIAAQTDAPEEILIVDDGSTDDTAEIAERYPGVRVVRMGVNRGPSAARNRAAREARYAVLFYLDSDIVLPPESVAEVRRVFSEHPEVGILSGCMEKEPLNQGLTPRYKALLEYGWGQAPAKFSTAGRCINVRIGAIRCEVFLEAGGFNESYRKPSVEDYEFGLRLVEKYRIYHDPDLRARHHFQTFWRTAKNYRERAGELLELNWTRPAVSSVDNGGSSLRSALEALAGAGLVSSLPLLALPWWPLQLLPALSAILFLLLSRYSLWPHYRFGGLLFVLRCLPLHLGLMCVITLAGVETWVRFRLFGISRVDLSTGGHPQEAAKRMRMDE